MNAARALGFALASADTSSAEDPAGERDNARASLADAAAAASAAGLGLAAWVRLDRIAAGHPLVRRWAPRAFRPSPDHAAVVDPRRPFDPACGLALLARPDDAALADWWSERLEALQALGAARFIHRASPAADRLSARLAARGFAIEAVARGGEHPMAAGGPLLLSEPKRRPLSFACKRVMLAAAGAGAGGWVMSEGFERDLEPEVAELNRLLAGRPSGVRPVLRTLTGAGEPFEVVIGAVGERGSTFVRNRSSQPLPWSPHAPLPVDAELIPIPPFAPRDGLIQPGEAVLFEARRRAMVKAAGPGDALAAADPAARITIAEIAPALDDGRAAIKRTPGEPLAVSARIFVDGHTALAAELWVRAEDQAGWTRLPMRAEPNDVWRAETSFARVGRHAFQVVAWVDVWGGFAKDLRIKRDAGADIGLELREGALLVEAAVKRASGACARTLGAAVKQLARAKPEVQAERLLSHGLAQAMAGADARPFETKSFVQPVEVDRPAAKFSSWYELFPRSQAAEPGRHGRFDDVIARLPRVAAMGFDTVYFPPIHPIGEKNRKGPNNSLTAGPDDLGSPYAIGSAAGGHDAVHPALGTLADFRRLVAAARSEGLEVAIDFAIQCAPDHPWVKQHPGWFDWRPDGTIKYAENPPKKYQDIVNLDFYRPDSLPALWEALRDVVLFWAAHGVKLFRVDNPHTKPIAFWRWMIAAVKARHPDAIFLAEAFTRPAPMLELAKAGFGQSYTYFTWRNTKAELTEYFTELNTAPLSDALRPHLFVNTPDINPYFLQTSGRPGFLIRAALAATLSGLFGVYAGFEFCEAAPLPGREEYLDSEKYQIRQRPDRAAGDIVDEIAQLNAIRRAEPALQTHLGLQFHNAYDDQVLYYSKAVPGARSLILTAVSLDPHNAREADVEAPLWRLGLPDWATVQVENLVTGRRFRWTGKIQHVRLTPDEPYAIWRLAPFGAD